MESTLILMNCCMGLLLHIGVRLDPRNLRTLCTMIALLLKQTPLHLYEFARALPGKATVESRAQTIRRWLNNATIAPSRFVESLVALAAPVLSHKGAITLVIDRTDWYKRTVHLNIFFCSVAFFGRALPMYWRLLPHGGASTFDDQRALLDPVLAAIHAHPLLSALPCCVCADREFGSPRLADWLRHQWRCGFALRVKANIIVARDDIPPTPLKHFFVHLEQGAYYFFEHVTFTDKHRYDANLFLYWRSDCDEPLAVMTDRDEAHAASSTYGERSFIETMNRDVKSGGYEIETSRVTELSRVENLLIPAAFAYLLAVIQGRLEELRDPCPPVKSRCLSLFAQGRNRFNDIIERHPVATVYHFVREFVRFLRDLVTMSPTENVLCLCTRFTQQQALLL